MMLWGSGMFNILTVYRGSAFVVREKFPLFIQIIPEIYLKDGFQEKIVLCEDVKGALKNLSTQESPLVEVFYGPELCHKFPMKTLLYLHGNDIKALFYKTETLVYFQRLETDKNKEEAVNLSMQYLKRFGIETTGVTPLAYHWAPSSFQIFKYGLGRLFGRLKSLSTGNICRNDDVRRLFRQQKTLFWRDAACQAFLFMALVVMIGVLSRTGIAWYERVQEINLCQKRCIEHTSEQLHLIWKFQLMGDFHGDDLCIETDFLKKLVDSWRDRVVITSLEWKREGDTNQVFYQLVFNPEDEDETMIQFLDWLDLQHPRMSVQQKDFENGRLFLMETPL